MKASIRLIETAAPLIGTVLLAGAVAGQVAAGDTLPAAPAYQVLRFEEDWSGFAAGRGLSGWERLKFVPLDAAGSSYLSVGGQLRYRSEAVQSFMLAEGDDRDDVFGLARAMAHADLHLGQNLRLFVEGRHSVAHGRDLPGGRRPVDHDVFDVQNGFVEVGGRVAGSRVMARVGRQELLLGAQRLVSPLDWANTRRTFDGARARVQRNRLVGEAFWTRPVLVRNRSFNRNDPATSFSGLALSGAAGRVSSWTLYTLRLHQTGPVNFAGVEGPHDRTTVGARIQAGSLARVAAELEGGVQVGEIGDQRIRAGFIASDFSHQFAALPLRPTATVGLDWASGDRAAGGTSGTFHQLFPLGHAFVGYTDVLGRQNLIESRAVLAASVTPRLQLRASAHRFDRASTSDAVYAVSGAVLEEAGGRDTRGIGHELDLTGGLRVNRHARIDLGYGRFAPGTFLAGRPAGARTMNWGFVATSFTF